MSTVENARKKLAERGFELSLHDSIAVTTEAVASRKISYRVAEMQREERENSRNWKPTGEILELTVPLVDSAKVTSSRKRPAGYIIESHRKELAKDLLKQGVVVQKLSQEIKLNVESYRVDSLQVSENIYEGYVPLFVKTSLEEREQTFPKDSYYVSTAQPNAALIFKLMEPEDENSYATTGYLGSETIVGRLLPVHRLPERMKLPVENL